MKYRNKGNKFRRENAAEASLQSPVVLSSFFCFPLLFLFLPNRTDLLAHNQVCHSYIKPLILPKSGCGSKWVNSKSLKRRFPCFLPQSGVSGTQFSCWTCGCSSAFTLGIPVFYLHVSVQRLTLAMQTRIRLRRKAGWKHLSRLYTYTFHFYMCFFVPTHKFLTSLQSVLTVQLLRVPFINPLYFIFFSFLQDFSVPNNSS